MRRLAHQKTHQKHATSKKKGEEHALTHNTPIAAQTTPRPPPTNHRTRMTHPTALNATFHATERAHTPTHALH